MSGRGEGEGEVEGGGGGEVGEESLARVWICAASNARGARRGGGREGCQRIPSWCRRTGGPGARAAHGGLEALGRR